METAEFRAGLVRWLDEHLTELEPPYVGEGTLDEQMEQLSRVKRALFDAGWMRWGWPESVGGLGGPPMLRAVLGEEITGRDLVVPGFFSMTEILAPTLAEFAAAELAREEIPKLLSGEAMWCQGFSEPGTGSDLRRCPAGPRSATGTGSSTARSCGPASRSTRRAVCCSPVPAPPSRGTGASPRSSSTWTRRGSRCGRSRS